MKRTLTSRQRDGYLLLFGFLLWLVATVIFHFFGDLLIHPDNQVMTWICFGAAVPVIYACILPLYSLLGIPPSDRMRSAVRIALPGMVLDIFSLILHDKAFPVMSEGSIPILASWLLWAYSLILLTGGLARRHLEE